ncbi:MAG: hypothetical protein MOP50_637 [Nitrososphaera sp.]|nr:hypothetical protein [Nitrososphaera sp.]
MAEQFAFLGDKCKAAIAAVSLGVLLLLPASLGFGKTIVEEAYGQSNLPPLEGEEEGGGGEEEPTLPANASRFLLRGFLGSSLPAQDGDAPIENNNSSHIVAGRFRVFANESLVNRFIAEMDLAAINGAAINGAAFHNITIEETTPHRFELTESGNGTTTTTATGSIPPVSSNLMTRIYVDSNTPIIDNVPMTISIRSQVLAIEGIDIDETRITDTGQQDILSIFDGQSIYGTIPRG